MTRKQQMSLADKLNSLARIDDIDRLLLGLDCLADEVRDMIREKNHTFIDELLGLPGNRQEGDSNG
jgi:hypothetical protein